MPRLAMVDDARPIDDTWVYVQFYQLELDVAHDFNVYELKLICGFPVVQHPILKKIDISCMPRLARVHEAHPIYDARVYVHFYQLK